MLVYKYRSAAIDTFEMYLFSIEKNYFWAPNFENLNDPFETVHNSERLLEQLNSISELKRIEGAYNDFVSLKNKIGIFSLSQSYQNNLLWAHYGNSHNGFCIEYDLETLLEGNLQSFPITYKNCPPSMNFVNIVTKPNEILKKLVGYKDKSWKYETEYRIITDEYGEFYYNYKAVKSIFFGVRMTEKKKAEVMNRLKGRGVNYYQIKQMDKSYKLKAYPIDDINDKKITYLKKIIIKEETEKIINFNLIKSKIFQPSGIGEMEIILENIISEKELLYLAEFIKDNIFNKSKTLFILYHIKNKKENFEFWASTNYKNNKFEVKINNRP